LCTDQRRLRPGQYPFSLGHLHAYAAAAQPDGDGYTDRLINDDGLAHGNCLTYGDGLTD
jgi:hypothetical protein